VGSRSKISQAYIAGFLDGDGSLMMQIKKRTDGRQKYRFMLTICFYQDSRHEQPLHWIRKELGIGYISKRNDNISELRINGYRQIREILKNLLPYIRFKKNQANALYKASLVLSEIKNSKLSKNNLLNLVNAILVIQKENYVAHHKKSKEELLKVLGLTP
jgi:hypothetical protein